MQLSSRPRVRGSHVLVEVGAVMTCSTVVHSGQNRKLGDEPRKTFLEGKGKKLKIGLIEKESMVRGSGEEAVCTTFRLCACAGLRWCRGVERPLPRMCHERGGDEIRTNFNSGTGLSSRLVEGGLSLWIKATEAQKKRK